jgi:hypothetical protein
LIIVFFCVFELCVLYEEIEQIRSVTAAKKKQIPALVQIRSRENKEQQPQKIARPHPSAESIWGRVTGWLAPLAWERQASAISGFGPAQLHRSWPR